MNVGEGDSGERLDRLAEEYVARARRGEAPEVERYAKAHPDLADAIRELFPLLDAMEDVVRASDAAEAPSVTDPVLPPRVGDWEPVRVLGHGGMGRVLEVRHVEDGRRAALKLIHPHLLERAGFLDRFLQEARLGRDLSHPHLVATIDAGTARLDGADVPYLVLEYVEGRTLRALLDDVGALPERLCRHVGARVAEALAAIHAVGILHRDVKPENVIVTSDETVKLMDLGVALVQDAALRLSRTGEFVGSLLYAAPEQLAGAPAEPAADLYGLGLLLFELSTGRHPGTWSGVAWLEERGRRAPSPRQRAPDLSPFLDAVVTRLLDPRPEERLADAGEAARILAEGEASTWWRRRTAELGARTRLRVHGLPFRGREAELARLRAAWERAASGHGGAVLVEGERGMGKTRLVEEWIASLPPPPAGPLVQAATYGPGEDPLGECPLPDAVLALLGETDDVAARLEALVGSDLARAFLEPPTPQAQATGMLRVLGAVAKRRPVVLVVSDVHLAPQAARRRFLGLARGVADARVLLVATALPGSLEGWDATAETLGVADRLVLEPLDREACEELAQLAASARGYDPTALRDAVERSDGNPLFLLELARSRPGRRGTAQVGGHLEAVVRSRLEGLDEEDAELLACAACCGFAFDPLLVARVLERSPLAVLRRLARLEKEDELLRPDGRDYRFRHHVVQETLYERLHPAHRESMHEAIASRLAEDEGGGLLRHAELCHHRLRGTRPADARPLLATALDSYAARHEHDRARDLAELALARDPAIEGSLRARLLLAVGRASLGDRPADEVRPRLEEAVRLADAAGDRRLAARGRSLLGSLFHRGGQYEEAVAVLRKAMVAYRDLGDASGEAMALGELGTSLAALGREAEALQSAQTFLDIARDSGDPGAVARAANDLGAKQARRGRTEAATALLLEALEAAERCGGRELEATALANLGLLAAWEGRHEAAIELLDRCLLLRRELGLAAQEAHSRATLASVLLACGELARSEEEARRALAIAERLQLGETQGLAHVRVGQALEAAGRYAEALDAMAAAERIAERTSNRRLATEACIGRLQRLLALGRHEEVLEALPAAREAADGGPLATSDLETLEGLAHENAGRLDEAQAAFERAHELLGDEGFAERRAWSALDLARIALASGRSDSAASRLETLLAEPALRQIPTLEVLARAYGARRDPRAAVDAKVVLEKHEARLPAAVLVEAHHVLAEATGEAEHREAARARLERILALAPEDARERLRTGVALHRAVLSSGAGDPQ